MNNEFKGLRHYINIVESAQQVDEEGVLNALGQLGGAVAGTAKNAVTGAYDAAKNAVTGAVDAAGNAISGVVNPVVQGAKQGYAASQGAPAAGQAANPTKKPAAPAKPAAAGGAKPDPAVLKLQQDLIAKGAKIKADGIMGPATQAAQKQFGGTPAQAAPGAPDQSDAETKRLAAQNAAAAPAAGQAANPTPAAAPAGMTAVGDDEGNTTITRPDGSTMVVGPDGKQIMPGSNPNLPQNKGVFNTIKNAATGQGDFQKPTGFIPPATNLAVKESTGYDEIQRIVSLIHYK